MDKFFLFNVVVSSNYILCTLDQQPILSCSVAPLLKHSWKKKVSH